MKRGSISKEMVFQLTCGPSAVNKFQVSEYTCIVSEFAKRRETSSPIIEISDPLSLILWSEISTK